MGTLINNEYYFIFKAKTEIGFANFVQLGPTFQVENEKELNIPLNNSKTLIEFKQSEEGGRFFQNISHYKIALTKDINDYESSDEYYVLNVFQICELLKVEGIFTNESRTLIASLLTIDR